MEIRPLSERELDSFGELLCSTADSAGCWCMWFVRRVADYHEGGGAGNRAALVEQMQLSPTPIGFLAYDRNEPVGWCSAGPRSRYARVLRAPTLKGRDVSEDDSVWLAPCFLIRPDRRRSGVASALLDHAVRAAAEAGAPAIEGFPLSGSKARSGGADFMTGTEMLFEAAGFTAVRRPSNNRVIMRRDL